MRILYPDAEKCDSLALTFVADSVKVTETETPGTYNVNFGGGASATIIKSEDGKMTVTSSHGLFAYSEEKLSMALSTGWITPEMDDLQLQERFSDEQFINSLADKLMAGLKSNLKASCNAASINMSLGTSKYKITVRNNNAFDVPADAYSFVLTRMGWDPDREKFVPVGTKVLDGVAVQAKSTATCSVPGSYDYEYNSMRVAVKIKYSKEQAVSKLLVPTGNEYEEYLKAKGQ